MAHPVDLFVDLAFFLDKGIGPGDVSLGLIVIIIANKVFDGIVGEEPFEFAV